MLDADRSLFEAINGLAGRSRALDNVMEMLVSDFFLPVVLSLAAFALWFYGRSAAERYEGQWAFLYASIGVGFSNLVVTIFNSAIDRPRPTPRSPATPRPSLSPSPLASSWCGGGGDSPSASAPSSSPSPASTPGCTSPLT